MKEREIEFQKVLNGLSNELTKVPYQNGDLSDIGNEVGFILGGLLSDMNQEEITDFIHGFKHGVSLTNGTH